MSERIAVRATLDRIVVSEAGKKIGVLVFDDGQQLTVDARCLPGGIAEKEVIRLTFAVDSKETRRRVNQVEQLQRELFGQ
jgi:hypothetical protein